MHLMSLYILCTLATIFGLNSLNHPTALIIIIIIMPSSLSFTIISKSTVYPDHKSSSVQTLRLSVSDLPMLACHYIQKGVLLTAPPPNHHNHEHLISDLKASLSTALAHFPALAGRLTTDSSGHIHITCNDSGVEFVQASAKHLTLSHLISPDDDVHAAFKKFFTFDATLSYSGHTKPLAAVQVTELADGLFIGCTVNHAVVDGTSFWHFFNTFAEISKGCKKISHVPDFVRSISPFDSSAVLKIPPGGPKATFADDEPLRERIFHFSKEAIADLKLRANSIVIHIQKTPKVNDEKMNGSDLVKFSALERLLSNNGNDVAIAIQQQKADEISSFQSLSAQLWRSITRVRDLKPEKQTTFRMAVNCRSRLEPNLSSHYFGNAIQSIPTVAPAGELLANDLNWAADQLHKNVMAHDDAKIRWGVKDWESNPRLFPLGNFDGAMITMGSSPRFPMYNNDFGWGRPVAVRSGKANKFDGKISAFPGRDGGGSVDLEVCLTPETMAGLERDYEFMQYVSACNWLK